MLSLINYDKNTNQEPEIYIFSRMTDPHGRPICFAFSGSIEDNDGSDIFPDIDMLRNSVNLSK